MEVETRLLTKIECNDALNIIAECGKDMSIKKNFNHWNPTPVTLEYLEKNLKKLYGCFLDKKMVGTFMLFPEDEKPDYYQKDQWTEDGNSNIIYIKRFAVSPKIQSKGIGGKMLKFIEKQHPNHWIRLDVMNKNQESLEFYKKYEYLSRGTTKTENASGVWEVECFEKKISKL
jgi:GNAT superfamily N-acetyltransferase